MTTGGLKPDPSDDPSATESLTVRSATSDQVGGRPGPGGPAKAWATEIQSSARCTGHHQLGVGHVAALGDHQAEVEVP